MKAIQDLAFIGGDDGNDPIIVDCLVSDTHEFEATVSEWPVESGATIADHVRLKPVVINMEIVVSNHPFGPIADIRQPDIIAPADEVYVRLMQIREARQPVTIRTSLDTYRDMVIVKITIPRDSKTGEALACTVIFQQIKVVKTDRSVRVAIPQARRHRVISAAPVSATSKEDFLHRNTFMVKIYKQAGTGDWLWFDDNIAGWRYRATYEEPGIFSRLGPFQDGYVVSAERPYGVTTTEWNGHRKTDQQYRDDIANAYEASAQGGGPLNKYDPFLDFGTTPPDSGFNLFNAIGSGGDVRLVRAVRQNSFAGARASGAA